MKVLSILKSHKLVSSIVSIALVSSIGIVSYSVVNNQSDPIMNSDTENTIKEDKSKVSTDKVIDKKIIEDKAVETIQPQKIVEKLDAKKEKKVTVIESEAVTLNYEDAWMHVYKKVISEYNTGEKPDLESFRIISAIMKNYSKNKELFTDKSIDSTITTCGDHFKSIKDENVRAHSFAIGDCGF